MAGRRSREQDAALRRWLNPRQRRLLVAATATVGAVALYKLYRSERLKATHAALTNAADTLGRYHAAAASAGQVAAVLAEDIRAFLASDTDEVPRSVRQLAKLVRSGDVQRAIAACVASAVRGAADSSGEVLSALTGASGSNQPSVVDKVIEAVLSDRGQSLVGLAVRAAACQSTEVFCAAVRSGLEAALAQAGGSSGSSSWQGSPPAAWMQQQQRGVGAGGSSVPASPAPAAGTFYSAASSPLASPQGFEYHHHQHLRHHHQQQQQQQQQFNGLHPLVGSALTLLSSPQLLAAVDGLVSTTVGSSLRGYFATAGSSSELFSSVLATLSQPSNKRLAIDIMSQVSAAFCREMAAACVAPAAAVAVGGSSRPASRLSVLGSPGGLLEQQLLQDTIAAAAAAAAAASPAAAGGSPVPLPRRQQQQQQQHDLLLQQHHSVSEAELSAAEQLQAEGATHEEAGGSSTCPPSSSAPPGGDGSGSGPGSEPSSPQSGPGTPEPSVAAAQIQAAAAGATLWQRRQQQQQAGYGSFAGSAVAGLILRAGWPASGAQQQVAAAGGSYAVPAGGGGPAVLVDPASLGPLSTVVTLFVQAARFQEFRSLMVDVSRSSTREFVRSLLPSGWAGAVRSASSSGSRRANSSSNDAAALALTGALYRVYCALSVVLLLMVYALGPRTLLLEGTGGS